MLIKKGGQGGRRFRSAVLSPGRPGREAAGHAVEPGREVIHRLLTVDDIYLLTQHRGEMT